MLKLAKSPQLTGFLRLIQPTLLVALGIHAVVLFAPLSWQQSAKKMEPEKQKEASVKITQLQLNQPKVSPPKLAQPSLPRSDRPATPKVPPIVPPQPAKTKSQPAKRATRNEAAKNPFAEFPQFQPSTAGCAFNPSLGDQCRIASANLAAVTNYFKQALPDKKFAIALEENAPERKIFKVSKGEQSLFLNLFSDGATTVYLLAPEKISNLAALKKAIGLPTRELNELLALVTDTSSGSNDATPLDFLEPTAFYSDPEGADPGQLAAVFASPKVVAGQSSAQVLPKLQAYLKKAGFKVAEVGAYGGGALQQISKGSFTGFLNLVPTRDRAGTVVVLWTQKP